MKNWKNMDWRQRRKERKAKIAELVEATKICRNHKECLNNTLKLAMMVIKYPGDSPEHCPEPLEILAMQLSISNDEKDLEFLLKFFPNLMATRQAVDDDEKQRSVLDSERFEVPEELKGQKKRVSK